MLLTFPCPLIADQENDKTRMNSPADAIIQQARTIAENHPDSAITYLILHSDELNSSPTELAKLYYETGLQCKSIQYYDAARNYFSRALAIDSSMKNTVRQVDILIKLGQTYRRLGNFDLALKSDMKALSLAEKQNKTESISTIYNNIGVDHYRYHNFEEAIVNLRQSLMLRKKENDSTGIADCYNNLGMVYDDLKDTARAMENYNKALLIYEQTNDLDGLAASYNNIAGVYYQQNNFPKVLEFVKKSLEIRRKEGNKRKIAFNLLNISSLYFSINEFDEALKYVQEGLSYAQQTGAKSQIRRSYEKLSDIYATKGDYRQAYQFHVLYAQLNDSIFEENKARAIAEIQTKYETEKEDIENQLLKNRNHIKTRTQTFLIVVVIGLVLLIILLVYYLKLRNQNLQQQKELVNAELLKKEQEKQQLEDKVFAEKQINKLQKEKFSNELKYKNRQLAGSTLHLIKKNEVLGVLKNKIEALELNKEETSEILDFINCNLDMDAEWKKFKVEFNETYPGFFDRLSSAYPGLSDTHLKICTFLRINLTTHEIADLLYVSVAAINKNRQRLRKLFHLEAEADLHAFLCTI
jgi:tetratricopeptide (TPR) repeat protein